MRAKKCKQIRVALRQRGIDPKLVSYVAESPSNRRTAKCNPTSGRGLYKAAKKALKQGGAK